LLHGPPGVHAPPMRTVGGSHLDDEVVARLDRIIGLLEGFLDQRRASPTGPPLGVEELAALLKHTPHWVRGQCRAGRLPHQKIGKLYLFTPDDVAEIFAATAVKVRSEPAVRALADRRRTRTFYRPS
jgi:hypothetical protein